MFIVEDRYKVFLVCLATASLVIVVAFAISTSLSILIAIFFLTALWVVRPLWASAATAYARVLLACVALLSVAAAYYLAPQYITSAINSAIVAVNRNFHIGLSSIDASHPPAYILFLLVVGIAMIVRAVPDRTIMPPLERLPDSQTGSEFKGDLLAFAELWEHRLNIIDRETNWSNRDFVSIDAEVEVHSLDRNNRRVGDIVKALRLEQGDQPILILGEPGSGKSVVLRRLCRDLLKETASTGRLPVYINLKNWTSPIAWSVETPPSTAELRNYIHAYIHREADDMFADRFLRENFESMLKKGTLFFILDSFDEIPAVMDHAENSWVIGELSNVIGQFLRGAHASKGIVASRYFKRPSDRLAAGAIYRIKPFDESRIRTVLRQVGMRSEDQVREVFRSRADLVSAAANPLIANLLATYVREHGGEWPLRKLHLFNDYIQRQLSDEGIRARSAEVGLHSEAILETTIAVAWEMMKSDEFGLEIPVQVLTTRLSHLPIDNVLRLLKFARLGRLSITGATNFSFVHRRFQEFFVVVGMLQAETIPELDAILSDTRYRDILALYCEVATAAGANSISAYCWRQIEEDSDQSRVVYSGDQLEVVHSLRFLTEAFRSRRDFTDEFLEKLAKYIREQLRYQDLRPLTAKFASEAVALLDDARAAELFPIALTSGSAWVRETAFRACRHLVTVSPIMRRAALDHVLEYRNRPVTGTALIKNHRDLQFSLSISDGFRAVRNMELAWLADAIIFAISFFGLAALSPIAAICVWAAISYVNSFHPVALEARLVRAYVVGISIFLISLAAIYLYGVGWLLGFPTWWPSNPLLFWDGSISSFTMASCPQCISYAYTSFVGLCLLGLLPLVPIIVAVYCWPRSGSAFKMNRGLPKWARRAPLPRRKQMQFFSETHKPISWSEVFQWVKPIAIGVPVGIAVVPAISWLLNFLGPKISLALVLSFVGLLLLYGGVTAGAKRLFRYRRDLKVLNACRVSGTMQREQIQEVLESLEGAEARLKFVGMLLSNHVLAVGKWRDGRLPFQSNDRVSDELARLEERWLGLDH